MRHRISVVACSLVLMSFLAASAAADVPRGSDAGRRPSGPRIAGSKQSGSGGSCSVTGDGKVLCWGDQQSITLATTTVPFSAPVQIAGVTSAVAVSVGKASACALRADGKVLCWGHNLSQQLGREPRTDSTLPADEVPNLSDVVQLAVGSFHVCAVTVSSSVLCWGANSSQQLAQDSSASFNGTPTVVPGLAATAVSAGARHTCALRNNGTVACWGDNDFRQSAPLSNSSEAELTEIGLAGIVDISAGGEHACALAADGTVACWGRNMERQVEPGAVSAVAFAGVAGVANATSLASGADFSCAVIVDGTIKCWGADQTGFIQPAIGNALEAGTHCVVSVLGSARCFTLVPPFTVSNRSDPEPAKARSIALGGSHSCARRLSGQLACWGENGLGQLGDGTLSDRPSPVTVLDGTHPASAAGVAAGSAHGCMRTPTGRVSCWGDNSSGQIGDPTRGGVREMFTVIDSGSTPLANVVAVTNGAGHSCALLANGRAKCWGSNADGQLGDGTRTTPVSPANAVFVKTSSTAVMQNIRAIAAGDRHTCALLADGTARCWGANDAGQVTGHPGNDILTPASVAGGVAIAAGEHHTCVLGTSVSATCWGWNSSGELGPTDASGQHTFAVSAVGIAAGDSHSCAVKANGTMACWGANASGQLGNQSGASSTSPVTVKELVTIECPGIGTLCTVAMTLGNMIAIDTGGAHSCAIRADGQPYCWGADGAGQLGDGAPASNRSTARPVQTFGGS